MDFKDVELTEKEQKICNYVTMAGSFGIGAIAGDVIVHVMPPTVRPLGVVLRAAGGFMIGSMISAATQEHVETMCKMVHLIGDYYREQSESKNYVVVPEAKET